jgi:hydroxypyruvate isomerase
MLNIAANISLLFREMPLLERFEAARAAGFKGVEIQFPYAEPAESLAGAARRAGTPVILINGPVLPGTHPFGLAGRPEMRDTFRAQLPQICEYGAALHSKFVHILAGIESSPSERGWCQDVYVDNLSFAASVLGERGIQVLIEPLNPQDVPHYLLGTLQDAQRVIERCGGRIGLQFDAYHVARMGLDPAAELKRVLSTVRHVQFADAPGRHEPGTGQVSFEALMDVLETGGYEGWLGAEYMPLGTTLAGLEWLKSWYARSSGGQTGLSNPLAGPPRS